MRPAGLPRRASATSDHRTRAEAQGGSNPASIAQGNGPTQDRRSRLGRAGANARVRELEAFVLAYDAWTARARAMSHPQFRLLLPEQQLAIRAKLEFWRGVLEDTRRIVGPIEPPDKPQVIVGAKGRQDA